LFILTVSRQTGSLGADIARALAKELNVVFIDREYVFQNWLSKVATSHELNILKESPRFHKTLSKEGISFSDYIEKCLRQEVEDKPAVILGLGAQVIFQDHPDALHVRFTAPEKLRLERIMNRYGIENSQGERLITLSDRKHKKYLSTIFEIDWEDTFLYHLCINTEKVKVEESIKTIMALINIKQNINFCISYDAFKGAEEGQKAIEDEKIHFVHPSEEEFAKILDMYEIQWEYEPTTFPIEWDVEGNVTLAFSPDFYLPAFDTYIELTTMNQKYVTEKNKKVRRLKELYPEININIIYKKDYHTLLKRFGVEGKEVR
jgi:cytidylate kinase